MLVVKPWMAVEPAPTSHSLAGLPGLRFSTTTGLSAARAVPPGATVPRRAAARATPVARDAAAGNAGGRFAVRTPPNESRLAVIAVTFAPSRTIRSPQRCVRRQDRPQDLARICGAGRMLD